MGLKILILKPSSLGDVIQALPVLRLLKRHRPDSRIYWWIESAFEPLLRGDPDLEGLFVFQRKRWSGWRGWPELIAHVRSIRAHRFDCALDLQALARSALVSWFAKAGRTIGLRDWREAAPLFYSESIPRPSETTHAVDWYLEALKLLEIPVSMDFEWMPENPAARAALERDWRVSNHRWIALQPGARWENKRWPLEHWRDLIGRLKAGFPDRRCVVMGGKADFQLGERLAEGNREYCVNAAGKTTLPEMVEWIRSSDLMVSNDTGPMHAAAAMGVPVIAMFGPTHPLRTGPYGQTRSALTSSIACSPCMKPVCRHVRPLECLHAITPSQVFQIAKARVQPMLE